MPSVECCIPFDSTSTLQIMQKGIPGYLQYPREHGQHTGTPEMSQWQQNSLSGWGCQHPDCLVCLMVARLKSALQGSGAPLIVWQEAAWLEALAPTVESRLKLRLCKRGSTVVRKIMARMMRFCGVQSSLCKIYTHCMRLTAVIC